MIGTQELLLVLLIILLLFGGRKLPELARSLGLAKKEFEKAAAGEEGKQGEKKPENPAG